MFGKAPSRRSNLPQASLSVGSSRSPKRGGSVRPVVNLRPLNKFVAKKKFKMENSAVLRDLIKPKDWMTSIDLKDAFLSVPMAAHHRKLLRFMCRGRLYEFQCLPFGLTSAPRTFTKVMKPVMAVLRRRGIRSMIFLDDLLLLSSSKEELAEITKEVIILLQRLGFLINEEKSTLLPTQKMAYLGFLLDSVRMTNSLPPDKLEAIVEDCRRTLVQTHVSVRDMARLIGRMSQAILPAPLFYRNLQRAKNAAFSRSQSYDAQVHLDQPAKQDILWWMEEVPKWNGKPIVVRPPDLVVESDASLLGWGASVDEVATGGPLVSSRETQPHQCPRDDSRDICSPDVRQGTAEYSGALEDGQYISCVIRESPRRNALVNPVPEGKGALVVVSGQRDQSLGRVPPWGEQHDSGLPIKAGDVLGVDVGPRGILPQLVQMLGCCKVDLFATRLNTQLTQYVAWKPDPFAMATDALAISWSGLQGYAFPPFSLVGRCLRKLATEGSTIVLVAPAWPHQSWYPLLLESVIDLPVLLPWSVSLLRDPFGQPHPLLQSHSLPLAGWKVSGKSSLRTEFLHWLQNSYRQRGARGTNNAYQSAWLPVAKLVYSKEFQSLFKRCEFLREFPGLLIQERASSIGLLIPSVPPSR